MSGKYSGVDGKHPEQGYVDCSGWVATMQNATMREINEEAGRTVFDKSEIFSLGNDGAAMILKKAQERSGVLIEGKAVTADRLKEGMIIGEDNGPTKWDAGRYKGIDHITMVVRDPKNGELKISQSRGGEGVELISLDSYLERKQARGVKLYASDPLAEARDLLQDRAQGKQQEKGEQEPRPARPQAAAAHSGVLREQSQGPDVQKLQQALQQLGYRDAQGQALKADGSFGPRTEEAVKAFQRAHGLQEDGIAGRATLGAFVMTQHFLHRSGR